MNWHNSKPLIRVNDDTYEISDLELRDFTASVTRLHSGKHTRGHSHKHQELYFFLGETLMILGDDTLEMNIEDIVIVPSGKFHQVYNTSPRDISFLCVWANAKSE